MIKRTRSNNSRDNHVKLLQSLRGKYPDSIVDKEMEYSRSSIPNAMGMFNPERSKIGIGYLPDKLEGVSLGIATAFDKFIIYPAINQYLNPTGVWSYLTPLWFIKGQVAEVMNHSQGFVGPLVLGTIFGMGLKRLTLASNPKDVLEHEKKARSSSFFRRDERERTARQKRPFPVPSQEL